MYGLVVITAIITILAGWGLLRTFRDKNLVGIAFAALTLGVFGWFTVMTIVNHGIPAVAHH